MRLVCALKDEPIIEHSPGIVLIRNKNTTIGYCRYFENGDVEYIFVNSMYRRQGHGATLLREVAIMTGQLGLAHQPISPLGRQFFTAHDVAMQPGTDSVQ